MIKEYKKVLFYIVSIVFLFFIFNVSYATILPPPPAIPSETPWRPNIPTPLNPETPYNAYKAKFWRYDNASDFVDDYTSYSTQRAYVWDWRSGIPVVSISAPYFKKTGMINQGNYIYQKITTTTTSCSCPADDEDCEPSSSSSTSNSYYQPGWLNRCPNPPASTSSWLCDTSTVISCNSHNPAPNYRCDLKWTSGREKFMGSYSALRETLDFLWWPRWTYACRHSVNFNWLSDKWFALRYWNDIEINWWWWDDVWDNVNLSWYVASWGIPKIIAWDWNDWYLGEYSEVNDIWWDWDAWDADGDWMNWCWWIPDWAEIHICSWWGWIWASHREFFITWLTSWINWVSWDDVFLTTNEYWYSYYWYPWSQTVVLWNPLDEFIIEGETDDELAWKDVYVKDDNENTKVTIINHEIEQYQFLPKKIWNTPMLDFFGYDAWRNTLNVPTSTFKNLWDALHVAGDWDTITLEHNYRREDEQDDIFPMNKHVTVKCNITNSDWLSCASEWLYVNLHSNKLTSTSWPRFVKKLDLTGYEKANFTADPWSNFYFDRVDLQWWHWSSRIKPRWWVANIKNSKIHNNFIPLIGSWSVFVVNSSVYDNWYYSKNFNIDPRENLWWWWIISWKLNSTILNSNFFHNELWISWTWWVVNVWSGSSFTGHVLNFIEDIDNPARPYDNREIWYGIFLENWIINIKDSIFWEYDKEIDGEVIFWWNERSIYWTWTKIAIESTKFVNNKVDYFKSRYRKAIYEDDDWNIKYHKNNSDNNPYTIKWYAIFSYWSDLATYEWTSFKDNNYPIEWIPNISKGWTVYIDSTEFDRNGIYQYNARDEESWLSETIVYPSRRLNVNWVSVLYDYIDDDYNVATSNLKLVNRYNNDKIHFCWDEFIENEDGTETLYKYICYKLKTPAIYASRIDSLYVNNFSFFHELQDSYNIRTSADSFVSKDSYYYDWAIAKTYDVDNLFSKKITVRDNVFIQSEFADTYYFLKVMDTSNLNYFWNRFVNNPFAHNSIFLDENERYPDDYLSMWYRSYLPDYIRENWKISYVQNEVYDNTEIWEININISEIRKTRLSYYKDMIRFWRRLIEIENWGNYIKKWVDDYVDNIYSNSYWWIESKTKAYHQLIEISTKLNLIADRNLTYKQRVIFGYLNSKIRIKLLVLAEYLYDE